MQGRWVVCVSLVETTQGSRGLCILECVPGHRTHANHIITQHTRLPHAPHTQADNVMLKSCGGVGRGVLAKVADFGLAVKMDTSDKTHMSGMFQGTPTHSEFSPSFPDSLTIGTYFDGPGHISPSTRPCAWVFGVHATCDGSPAQCATAGREAGTTSAAFADRGPEGGGRMGGRGAVVWRFPSAGSDRASAWCLTRCAPSLRSFHLGLV